MKVLFDRGFRDRTAAALLAIAAGASSCTPGAKGGTDVGNGATASVRLRAYEPVVKTAASLTVASGARIDALTMVVGRVRLSPGTTCDGGDDGVDLRGPVIADLLTGAPLAGTTSFAIDPGSFCRFRLDFEKLDENRLPAGVPADLADLSIVMKGARADGVEFEVRSSLNGEFERDAKAGSFELDDGQNPLFLAFDVGPWIDALDLAGASGDPIVVDHDHDAKRLQAFEDAVRASGQLFRDEDGDDAFSKDEQGPNNQLTR